MPYKFDSGKGIGKANYLIMLTIVFARHEGDSSPTSSLPIWNLSLEEAESLAGFDLLVPADLPPGYRLDNVIFDPSTREVAQIYAFHPYSAGEQFILHQRLSQAQ